jgi:hypothetical protein
MAIGDLRPFNNSDPLSICVLSRRVETEQYCMILIYMYKGPGFLVVVCFGVLAHPLLPSPGLFGDTQEDLEREIIC